MPQLDSITFSLQVGLFFWLFWSLYIIVVVLILPQYLLVDYTKKLNGRKIYRFLLGFLLAFSMYSYTYTSIYAMEMDVALVEVPPVEVALPPVEVPPLQVPPVEVPPDTNFFSNFFYAIFRGFEFFANRFFSIFGLELVESSNLLDIAMELNEKNKIINNLSNSNNELHETINELNNSLIEKDSSINELNRYRIYLQREVSQMNDDLDLMQQRYTEALGRARRAS